MNRRHGGGISPVTGNCPIRETWMSGNKDLNKEGRLLLTEWHCLPGKTMSSPLFSAAGIRASLSREDRPCNAARMCGVTNKVEQRIFRKVGEARVGCAETEEPLASLFIQVEAGEASLTLHFLRIYRTGKMRWISILNATPAGMKYIFKKCFHLSQILNVQICWRSAFNCIESSQSLKPESAHIEKTFVRSDEI